MTWRLKLIKLIQFKEKERTIWLSRKMIKSYLYKRKIRLAEHPSVPEDNEARSIDFVGEMQDQTILYPTKMSSSRKATMRFSNVWKLKEYSIHGIPMSLLLVNKINQENNQNKTWKYEKHMNLIKCITETKQFWNYCCATKFKCYKCWKNLHHIKC